MRIFSWNVNGIRAVQKKGFLEWLQETQPDILCLQETKAWPDQLDEAVLSPEGYETHWVKAEKKGYSGCAIFTKKKPKSVETMGIEAFDNEGRVQVGNFGKFSVINAYFPNSQAEGKRLDYKLDFNKAMHTLCDKLVKQGQHIVLCGDYNVAHKPIDLAHPKPNEKNPGYLPEERAWMDEFTEAGYVDTFRHFSDEPEQYTWWSYRAGARAKNVGWRIDYHCVNPDFIKQVKASIIHQDVMGSDHCPIELVLKK